MLAQEIDVDRVLTVQLGRLTAYYGYDTAARVWVPLSELPAGFPRELDAAKALEFIPAWDE